LVPVCLAFTHRPATSIYSLSLHDALPILVKADLSDGAAGLGMGGLRHLGLSVLDLEQTLGGGVGFQQAGDHHGQRLGRRKGGRRDRKSTRLNSSHVSISYAVFCLKKKKTT